MKRWGLGFVVTGFFGGVAFILSAIVQNIFLVYRHSPDRPGLGLPLTAAIVTAAIALFVWVRATRSD
jgi:hypothetical protein